MAQVRTPSPFVATPFKSAPQPKKPKAPSATPTLPPPINNPRPITPTPTQPTPSLTPQPIAAQPRTAISPFTGQPVPVTPPAQLPAPVQQPTPTPPQAAPAANVPTQTPAQPKPPQAAETKPPTPFQALPPQQATANTPAVPFQSGDKTEPAQKINARASKLAGKHKAIYDGLDHQNDLNGWNDSAFNDYLDMQANGEQDVMLDGVPMKGKDAARQMRQLMQGKKAKKGKAQPTTTPAATDTKKGSKRADPNHPRKQAAAPVPTKQDKKAKKKGKGAKQGKQDAAPETAAKRIQGTRSEAY